MVYMGPPLDGPVGLSVSFLMPRPTSKIWKRKPMPREWYPKRPDWDNLAKSLCDSLNGLAYFDDNQIVEAIIRKQIAEGSEQPGALVHIWDKPYLTESRSCV